MRFQVKPQLEFLVRPSLPPALSRTTELAYNLLWSWDHNIRAVFRRLDPQLWRASGHNPVLMLSQLTSGAIEKAAADPRYIALFRRACERFDAYMDRPSATSQERLIAYFCMEFGLVDCMPTYSGGLGLLAGDHLKAASDQELPLVAVGLLYQKGYLRQVLNPDGWQQERYPINDFYMLPVLPVRGKDGRDLIVSVDLPGRICHVKVWQMNVGRVTLYLLDTNIPENEGHEYRDITDQLYGGDIHSRMRQEIVLGIGGLRALKALGLEPTVFHMNEGHSAFLAIERIRLLMSEKNLSFEEALDAARQNNIFTTHTAVPAGFDYFEPGMLYDYFSEYCETGGLSFGQILALGRRNPNDQSERFSMAVCAIHCSAWRNAVSRLHRVVAQEMFQDMWPELPTWEVPITSVTNGVHLPTWLNGDLAALYDQYLQPDWLDRYKDNRVWDLVWDIPEAELWETRRRRKRRVVHFVRERVQQAAIARKASSAEIRRLAEVLDPDTFTIGFSRRFATYKRATLLFKDMARLKKILTNPDMPMQIIFAGKAHPKDMPGKNFIREIWQMSRDPEISRRLVFVEDYSIQVGRELVQGVDLWLNTPKRGEEACGTSGMKAALNGVLNLSVLDGWFDEAYEVSGGWAIGDREEYSEDQDDIHASAIYSMLENEIIPLYYRDRDRGAPEEWMRRVKQCVANITPRFNCQRMIAEYDSELYHPAHLSFRNASSENFRPVQEHTKWMQRVRSMWDGTRIVDIGPKLDNPAVNGHALTVRAVIDLGGLTPDDVRVEAVVGRIGVEGFLEDTTVVQLTPNGEAGGATVFTREFLPGHTGRLGMSVRLMPNHSEDPLTRPCHPLMKWG
ncbi:MAG TPA: alpha-glucan family phosphorylase [Bryobacteraceae bacterium]|nr:alpha-glucan family phosphorylase [Bryobacteraceae bacterium]